MFGRNRHRSHQTSQEAQSTERTLVEQLEVSNNIQTTAIASDQSVNVSSDNTLKWDVLSFPSDSFEPSVDEASSEVHAVEPQPIISVVPIEEIPDVNMALSTEDLQAKDELNKKPVKQSKTQDQKSKQQIKILTKQMKKSKENGQKLINKIKLHKRGILRKSRVNLPIGIALDGNTLVLCELQRSKSAIRGRKLFIKELENITFPLTEETVEDFMKLLLEMVKIAGWKGRKVVISAPSDFVMLRHISIAKMSNKVLDMAVHAEVGNHLSFPFEEPYFDYVIIEDSCIAEPDSDNLSVIVVAAPKIELLRYAACVRQTGLVPIRIEPAILGVRRMVVMLSDLNLSDEKQLYAVLNLRFNGAELGIFEGENMLFMRHIELKPLDYPKEGYLQSMAIDSGETFKSVAGGSNESLLPGHIKDFEASSYASDLGYEIDRSLNFVHYNLIKNGASVGLIYLVSAIADVAPIVSTLSGRLEQTIQVIEPKLLFEYPSRAVGTAETVWTDESVAYSANALGLSIPEVQQR